MKKKERIEALEKEVAELKRRIVALDRYYPIPQIYPTAPTVTYGDISPCTAKVT